MDFENINIEDIKIENSIKKSFDIKYNNKSIEFLSPVLYAPFGLERKYNDYFLNLQCLDYKKLIVIENFLQFLNNIEKKIMNLLDINHTQFNSQLRFNRNYDPIIYTKLIYKNKFITEAFKNNNYLNIFDLDEKFYCKCLLVIDKIWEKNGKFYYKIKLKKIYIIE